MAYEPVAVGDLAAVVTHLEMRERPEVDVPASELWLDPMHGPDVDTYRRLYRSIGAHWLWFSRLEMSDGELGTIIGDPAVEIWTVRDAAGADAGLLELDFREKGQCELAFIGLVPTLAGKGHGKWLLAEAVDRAWRAGIERVHVHTCTLDHPAALSAYRRAGFVPFNREIERFPDPRLTGTLPRDCAPQVPLIEEFPDS